MKLIRTVFRSMQKVETGLLPGLKRIGITGLIFCS